MMVRVKVLAGEVADTGPGGIVELDPERVNIDALVAAGLVEVVPERKSRREPEQS
jgi:hypothetical protein